MQMMTNLPEQVKCEEKMRFLIFSLKVSEEEIEEMFTFADKDKDGRISYTEFQMMMNPPKLLTDTPTPVKRVTINLSENDSMTEPLIESESTEDIVEDRK